MFRSILLMCGTLLVLTSGKSLVRYCSSGCHIVNQVLTCEEFDIEEDFPKISQCIQKYHGSLIVDIRQIKLECSCQFLEFAQMVHQTPRKIIFYDNVCSSKNIMDCGASEGVEMGGENPNFSLFGGKVMDISSDYQNKLINMHMQRTSIVDGLHKDSIRKLYYVAQKEVYRKALADAFNQDKTEKTKPYYEYWYDEDDEDRFEESQHDLDYLSYLKRMILFIGVQSCLLLMLVIFFINQDFINLFGNGKCVSNNAKASDMNLFDDGQTLKCVVIGKNAETSDMNLFDNGQTLKCVTIGKNAETSVHTVIQLY